MDRKLSLNRIQITVLLPALQVVQNRILLPLNRCMDLTSPWFGVVKSEVAVPWQHV